MRSLSARRRARTLARARTNYRDMDSLMVALDSLGEETRALLRPVLRQRAVQEAVLDGSGWWHVYRMARILTAVAALALPAGLLVQLTEGYRPGERAAAAVLFALLLSGVAAGYGVQERTLRYRHLALILAAIAVAVGVWAAVPAWWDQLGWRAVQPAVAATVAGAVIVVARLGALVAFRDRVVVPIALGPAGWLLPSQHVAARLLILVEGLEGAEPSNRHPRYRRIFVRWMDAFIEATEWEAPGIARNLGLGRAVVAETRQRVRDLGGRLRVLQLRLLHDHSADTYRAVRAEVDDLVRDICRGDWSAVAVEGAAAPAPSAWRRYGRRIATAVSLLAVAAGLPYLPGISADSGTLGGIQLGLVVAAALTLLPVEPAHRDEAVSSFRTPLRG